VLGRLFQATFSTARPCCTDTAIGEGQSPWPSRSSLAKRIFADLHRSQALLIGAGETISLVARHLHDQGIKRIVVTSHCPGRADGWLSSSAPMQLLLSDIPDELARRHRHQLHRFSQLPILSRVRWKVR
jgi:glutamyl-tRNA reductase